MKNLTLFLMCLSVILSCSKEKEADYITIDREKITLNYGDEKTVLIETNLDNVTAFTEDDYVADAFAGISSIDVWANKVGKTKIVVQGGEAEAELEVDVIPLNDNIGSPVVAFDKDAAYIKANEKVKFLGEASGDLFYSDSNVPFGANHAYRFKDGKLSYIVTTIGISKLNSKYDTYIIELSNSLKEKYEYSNSIKGTYQLMYIYTYKNGEYYIGAREAGGNGGWYVCYTKKLNELLSLMDVSSSFAL